jgi:hypothetical protein
MIVATKDGHPQEPHGTLEFRGAVLSLEALKAFILWDRIILPTEQVKRPSR